MTKLRSFLLFLLLILVSGSCSTEIDLEAPWKDIPVVYGFLSRQDTAHYLRVEKAFLPQGGDAGEAAQIPDSLYYDQLTVQLEKVNGGQVFNLVRVDGDLEGYPRKEGIFAAAPNYLYKISASEIRLGEGEPVRLILDRGEKLPLVSAETVVLEDVTPRSTSPASPINMAYDREVNFSWSAGENARIFDARLVIHYRESVPGDQNMLEPRSVEWVLDDALEREDDLERITVSILGEEFYVFLGQRIPVNSQVIRLFDGIDLRIVAGGQEMVDLLRITNANVGVTSFQSVPVYTNLSEGRGIFSSRAFAERRDMTLTSISLDSLRNGIYTRDLNFQ